MSCCNVGIRTLNRRCLTSGKITNEFPHNVPRESEKRKRKDERETPLNLS